jgi:hypothetical protein
MTYFPDCRTDEFYNEKELEGEDREFIRGFDWCVENCVDNGFDNVEGVDLCEEADVRPSDVEKVLEAFKPWLLRWIESSRNEVITAMLDHAWTERENSENKGE